MKRYFANTAPGTTWEFVGEGWEDGGFRVDEAGNPTHDASRNTVIYHSVSEVDKDDAALFLAAYAGDERITAEEEDAYAAWLEREAGLSPEDARELARNEITE